MSELGEKSGVRGLFPPFYMLSREYDFGLSEKDMQMLNKVIFNAMLQYSEECAVAEQKMIDTVQSFLKEIKFLKY